MIAINKHKLMIQSKVLLGLLAAIGCAYMLAACDTAAESAPAVSLPLSSEVSPEESPEESPETPSSTENTSFTFDSQAEQVAATAGEHPPTPSEGLFKEGEPVLTAAATTVTTETVVLPKLTELVKELSRAVVNISVEADVAEEEVQSRGLPFLPRGPSGSLFSLGSGIIISESGYVLTNNHVIDRAKRVVVRLLDDKHDYEAKVIGRDPKTDLALLKIESKKPLKAVFFGDSDTLEVGEWVVAIGNQFQLGQTVTAGIVSAKARKVPSRDASPYDSFIQTDASINPGSSGGPLFNLKGQVIGVNTAIFSPGRGQAGASGFNIGIGFAIPINIVKSIVGQLQENGKVVRGMLGVIIQPVDKDVVEALALEDERGALVADVMPNSPAALAGFKVKDIILSFNGKRLNDHDELPLMVASTPIGTKVEVLLWRAGKEKMVYATIDELKDLVVTEQQQKPEIDKLGLTTRQITAIEARALGLGDLPDGSVLVDAVENGSVAQAAGIARGDIVVELNNIPVASYEDYSRAVKGLTPGKAVLVLVKRKEGTRFITIRAPVPVSE